MPAPEYRELTPAQRREINKIKRAAIAAAEAEIDAATRELRLEIMQRHLAEADRKIDKLYRRLRIVRDGDT
jgi:hypothetical protein